MPKSANPMDHGYIMVADRLAAFNKDYPEGRIATSLVAQTFDPGSGRGLVIVAASVWKKGGDYDFPADGTGLSSMPIPGPTNFSLNSEVENAETSAVGRALAMIGYLAKNADGSSRISTDDEINAKNTTVETETGITEKQRKMIFAVAKKSGIDTGTDEGKAILKRITLESTGKYSSKQLDNEDVDKLVAALEAAAKVAEASGGEVIG